MLSGVNKKLSLSAEKLSERLAEALDARDRRAAWLARAAGITPAYVSRMLNGQNENPSPEVAGKMAEALDVSLNWLLSGSGEMEVPQDRLAEPSRGYTATPAETAVMIGRLEKRLDDLTDLVREIADVLNVRRGGN